MVNDAPKAPETDPKSAPEPKILYCGKEQFSPDSQLVRIFIELRDKDQKPPKNAPFRILIANGQDITGTTDECGRIDTGEQEIPADQQIITIISDNNTFPYITIDLNNPKQVTNRQTARTQAFQQEQAKKQAEVQEAARKQQVIREKAHQLLQQQDQEEEQRRERTRRAREAEPNARFRFLKDQSHRSLIGPNQLQIHLELSLSAESTLLPDRECQMRINGGPEKRVNTNSAGHLIINQTINLLPNTALEDQDIEFIFPSSGNHCNIALNEIPEARTAASHQFERNQKTAQQLADRQKNLEAANKILQNLFQKFLTQLQERIKKIENVNTTRESLKEAQQQLSYCESAKRQLQPLQSRVKSGEYIPADKINALNEWASQKDSWQREIKRLQDEIKQLESEQSQIVSLQALDTKWRMLITSARPLPGLIDEFLTDLPTALRASQTGTFRQEIAAAQKLLKLT